MESIKYPKRPSAHTTGEKAVNIFNGLRPSSWIINEQFHDYGVDLRIEITSGENVTGEEFLAQVKGHKSISQKPSQVFYEKIRPETINYWLRKLQPVMIISVDIKKQYFWYGWLHEAYSDYPKLCRSNKPISLSLQKHCQINPLDEEVSKYLKKYYDSFRTDVSILFEKLQLEKILLHVSELYRICSETALIIQGDSIENSDHLKSILYRFFLGFGMHDEFLMGLWSEFQEKQTRLSPQVNSVIGEMLDGYNLCRESFYMKSQAKPSGDFYLVPIRFSDIHKYLPRILNITSELQQLLLQILVLGRPAGIKAANKANSADAKSRAAD